MKPGKTRAPIPAAEKNTCKKNYEKRRFQHTVNAWKFSSVNASFFIRTLL
jgi:hypothetical protein